MMTKIKTFEHRYVVMVCKSFIVKDSTYSVKSYPTWADACHARDRANKRINTHADIIDTKTQDITENFCVIKKKIA